MILKRKRSKPPTEYLMLTLNLCQQLTLVPARYRKIVCCMMWHVKIHNTTLLENTVADITEVQKKVQEDGFKAGFTIWTLTAVNSSLFSENMKLCLHQSQEKNLDSQLAQVWRDTYLLPQGGRAAVPSRQQPSWLHPHDFSTSGEDLVPQAAATLSASVNLSVLR